MTDETEGYLDRQDDPQLWYNRGYANGMVKALRELGQEAGLARLDGIGRELLRRHDIVVERLEEAVDRVPVPIIARELRAAAAAVNRVVYERTHDRTIAKMSGLGQTVPVFATLMVFWWRDMPRFEVPPLPRPIIEFSYKDDALGDPLVPEEYIIAFGWASQQDLDNLQWGVGQARRGWLQADDVLNTRPLKELKKLLKR